MRFKSQRTYEIKSYSRNQNFTNYKCFCIHRMFAYTLLYATLLDVQLLREFQFFLGNILLLKEERTTDRNNRETFRETATSHCCLAETRKVNCKIHIGMHSQRFGQTTTIPAK